MFQPHREYTSNHRLKINILLIPGVLNRNLFWMWRSNSFKTKGKLNSISTAVFVIMGQFHMIMITKLFSCRNRSLPQLSASQQSNHPFQCLGFTKLHFHLLKLRMRKWIAVLQFHYEKLYRFCAIPKWFSFCRFCTFKSLTKKYLCCFRPEVNPIIFIIGINGRPKLRREH